MKTLLQISLCLLFAGFAGNSIAQQKASTPQQKTTKAKKHPQKSAKAVDNKIAVSDQAQPNDKKSSKTKKKSTAVSNK